MRPSSKTCLLRLVYCGNIYSCYVRSRQAAVDGASKRVSSTVAPHLLQRIWSMQQSATVWVLLYGPHIFLYFHTMSCMFFLSLTFLLWAALKKQKNYFYQWIHCAASICCSKYTKHVVKQSNLSRNYLIQNYNVNLNSKADAAKM